MGKPASVHLYFLLYSYLEGFYSLGHLGYVFLSLLDWLAQDAVLLWYYGQLNEEKISEMYFMDVLPFQIADIQEKYQKVRKVSNERHQYSAKLVSPAKIYCFLHDIL